VLVWLETDHHPGLVAVVGEALLEVRHQWQTMYIKVRADPLEAGEVVNPQELQARLHPVAAQQLHLLKVARAFLQPVLLELWAALVLREQLPNQH
jgi:hypothetical protein